MAQQPKLEFKRWLIPRGRCGLLRGSTPKDDLLPRTTEHLYNLDAALIQQTFVQLGPCPKTSECFSLAFLVHQSDFLSDCFLITAVAIKTIITLLYSLLIILTSITLNPYLIRIKAAFVKSSSFQSSWNLIPQRQQAKKFHIYRTVLNKFLLGLY